MMEGTINIDNCELAAIYHTIQPDESVTSFNRNGGLINIHLNSSITPTQSSITLLGQSKFINEDCSKIIMGETTRLTAPTQFTNLGTIVDYSSVNSSIFENSGNDL